MTTTKDFRQVATTSRPADQLRCCAVSGGNSRKWAVFLIVIQIVLLSASAFLLSPTADEVAYLPAGISHWRYGRFELFRANPPLVRMIAALPVLCVAHKTDWTAFDSNPGARSDFKVGAAFVKANGERSFWLFTLARLACIPFTVVGSVITYRWANELFGYPSGLAALALWVFCPNAIGNGAVIAPDAAAASFGLATAYFFSHWLRHADWGTTLSAGLFLGITEVTKAVWWFLFLLLPALWLITRLIQFRGLSLRLALNEFVQLTAMLAIAVATINATYCFDGSFKPLSDYQFVSRLFCGAESGVEPNADAIFLGNRFKSSFFRHFPVPVPEQYLLGIDIQRKGFEHGNAAYLLGEWKMRGWWYYYLVGIVVKMPIGTLLLIAFACARWRSAVKSIDRPTELLALLVPAICLLMFLSTQTGINRHFRYALPIFPFIIVWASSVFSPRVVASRLYSHFARVCVGLTMASSLSALPYSLSYFNELIGGPSRGHRVLLGSSTDWGQDLLFLRWWVRSHPGATPLFIAWDQPGMDPTVVGIMHERPPDRPVVGWHIVSVNQVYGVDGKYRYYLNYKPTAMIGYSLYVYHLVAEDIR